MAGPGGGPPRRSHTKSRKGCDACKRRHIRCDEVFPQCRNCTKHKTRCPYNDNPLLDALAAPSPAPDLMWTPDIQASIADWVCTGVFPFPSLNIYPTPTPSAYSSDELRLIHHLASICHKLAAIDANNFTLWTREIPTIIQISATNEYVMHALLAFSAMHIAHLNNCLVVGNLAFVYRGRALNGLQQAIDSFSPKTSDAVLAASLVLSWQATDWRSWKQLMEGTSTVMDAMDAWKCESKFGDFIAESCTFPTAPRSPLQDRRPSQPHKDDLDAFGRAQQHVLKLETYLRQSNEDVKLVQQLLVFMKGVRKFGPSRTIEGQFDRLRELRTWLFWLPVSCLEHSAVSTGTLVVIAHYYAIAIMVERLFPEIGAAYFGSLSIKPIEEITRRLIILTRNGRSDTRILLNLMEFPMETISEFRSRMGWVQAIRMPSLPHYDPPNHSYGEPVAVVPYGKNLAFSYSAEELPMLKTESDSPVALTSSLMNQQQYLSIPSPSYGAYSPASSTFEGSVAYSDSDDYGNFSYGSGSALLGDRFGGDKFSVGYSMPPSIATEHLPLDDFVLCRYQAAPPFLPPSHRGMMALRDSPAANMALLSHHRQYSSASAPASISAIERSR